MGHAAFASDGTIGDEDVADALCKTVGRGISPQDPVYSHHPPLVENEPSASFYRSLSSIVKMTQRHDSWKSGIPYQMVKSGTQDVYLVVERGAE